MKYIRNPESFNLRAVARNRARQKIIGSIFPALYNCRGRGGEGEKKISNSSHWASARDSDEEKKSPLPRDLKLDSGRGKTRSSEVKKAVRERQSRAAPRRDGNNVAACF